MKRVFRVFASKDSSDKALMKVKMINLRRLVIHLINVLLITKILLRKNTPHLDKEWYIAIAKKRINDFKGEHTKQLEFKM